MRNTKFKLAAVILGAIVLLVSACSAATTTPAATTPTPSSQPTSSAPPSTTAAAYTINLANSSTLGQYLVDGKGMTLYWTTADSPGASNVPDNLLSVWPVFYTANVVVPSSLNAGDFGTITRSNGATQTTYKGWPLYYYASDNAPGQTNGQGLGGKWSAVNPSTSGPQPVAPPTPSQSSTPAATSSTSTSVTFQTLAVSGETVYSGKCAICHGANGEGTDVCPVVMWGSGSTLGTYNGVALFTDAQGMLNFMSTKMPFTAPGSLSHTQYVDVLSYILIQAKLVSPSTTFDESQLSSIAIK